MMIDDILFFLSLLKVHDYTELCLDRCASDIKGFLDATESSEFFSIICPACRIIAIF